MKADHKCKGPEVWDGPYEMHLSQKNNKQVQIVYAKGKVFCCKICGWHYSSHDQGVYADAKEESHAVVSTSEAHRRA